MGIEHGRAMMSSPAVAPAGVCSRSKHYDGRQ